MQKIKIKKVVEDLAQDVYKAIKRCQLNAKGNCGYCTYRGAQSPDCQSWHVAKILAIENCYRKIQKDSVVLSKEEYERMIEERNTISPKVKAILQRCTAIDILSELVCFARRSLKRGCIAEDDFVVLVNRISRRYGLEVDNEADV